MVPLEELKDNEHISSEQNDASENGLPKGSVDKTAAPGETKIDESRQTINASPYNSGSSQSDPVSSESQYHTAYSAVTPNFNPGDQN